MENMEKNELDIESVSTAVDAEAYDENQIQVLEGLEAVRKRPGMYIGTTGPKGLHHLVYEIVDNAIDEALAGYCDLITVDIEKDDVIAVTDNGRGIPVGIQQKTGLPAVEVVFTILHAGGKFGGSGYKVSGGLHGVGASVVNALSEWLEVEVSDGEHVYFQRFERGKKTCDLHIIGDADQRGTKVRFKADPEMFRETTVIPRCSRRRPSTTLRCCRRASENRRFSTQAYTSGCPISEARNLSQRAIATKAAYARLWNIFIPRRRSSCFTPT